MALYIFSELNVFVDILCSYGVDAGRNSVTFQTFKHILSTNTKGYKCGIPWFTILPCEEWLQRLNVKSFVHDVQFDADTSCFVFDDVNSLFKGTLEILCYYRAMEPCNENIKRLTMSYEKCISLIENYCLMDVTCDLFERTTL
jgi:hypothetical protein